MCACLKSHLRAHIEMRSHTNRIQLVIFSSHLIVSDAAATAAVVATKTSSTTTPDDCNVSRCAAEATMCWNNIVVIGSKTYGDSHRIEANQMTWITRRKPAPNQDILTKVKKETESEYELLSTWRGDFIFFHLNKIQWFGRQQRRRNRLLPMRERCAQLNWNAYWTHFI